MLAVHVMLHVLSVLVLLIRHVQHVNPVIICNQVPQYAKVLALQATGKTQPTMFAVRAMPRVLSVLGHLIRNVQHVNPATFFNQVPQYVKVLALQATGKTQPTMFASNVILIALSVQAPPTHNVQLVNPVIFFNQAQQLASILVRLTLPKIQRTTFVFNAMRHVLSVLGPPTRNVQHANLVIFCNRAQQLASILALTVLIKIQQIIFVLRVILHAPNVLDPLVHSVQHASPDIFCNRAQQPVSTLVLLLGILKTRLIMCVYLVTNPA